MAGHWYGGLGHASMVQAVGAAWAHRNASASASPADPMLAAMIADLAARDRV